MLTPALDAVVEHIYINIPNDLGTGDGSSRTNAKGYTKINSYLSSVKTYSLITNKKHRIVHVSGDLTAVDDRSGDAGTPWTNVNNNYFYDVYVETDTLMSTYGTACPFIRLFNVKVTYTIACGTTLPSAEQWYINAEVISATNNSNTRMLTSYIAGGSTPTNGTTYFVNPKFYNSGTRIKVLDFNADENNIVIYGGAIILPNNTTSVGDPANAIIGTFATDSKRVVTLNNVAIHTGNKAPQLAVDGSGYTDGANIPSCILNHCTYNGDTITPNSKVTINNSYLGVVEDDLFVNFAGGNYLTDVNGTYGNAGADLFALPNYGYNDYDNWVIGLREPDPIPNALGISSFTSTVAGVVAGGAVLTINVVGNMLTTPGQVSIQDFLQTHELILTVLTWNNTTKVITVSVPVSGVLRYGDSNNIIKVTRSDGEGFSSLGSVSYPNPVGVKSVLGRKPNTTDKDSIFLNAVSVPVDYYQIQWKSDDGLDVEIDAFGVIVSTSGSGSVSVRVWDGSADNTNIGPYHVFNIATTNVVGRGSKDKIWSSVITPSATTPVIDSREVSGRPNTPKVYGTLLQKNRLMTIRTTADHFGTKLKAPPIVWWNGKELLENGIPSNEFSAVTVGDMVGAEHTHPIRGRAFASPSTNKSTVKFSDNVRYPEQGVSVGLRGGEYFGKPRAFTEVEPVAQSGTYISWRVRADSDYHERANIRYSSVIGTPQFGEGYKVVTFSGAETNSVGGVIYPFYKDPGGWAQLSYYPTGTENGYKKIVGLTSGCEIILIDGINWPYTTISGTLQIGEAVIFTDGDGTVFDEGTTVTAHNPTTMVVTLSRLPTGVSPLKTGGYLVHIQGKTSGAHIGLSNANVGNDASKTHRFGNEVGITGIDGSNRISTVGTAGRFWANRNGATYAEERYFTNGVWGSDAGYGFPRWSTGNWELMEVVVVLQPTDVTTGYAYQALNTIGRTYSNAINLADLDMRDMHRLICFGSDGTGGGETSDSIVNVNELYFDSTTQRVYLSNASTYKTSGKNLELQIPVKWNPNEVTFKINLGNLNIAAPLYLYVVDEKNYVNGVNVNAYLSVADVNGYAVTIT